MNETNVCRIRPREPGLDGLRPYEPAEGENRLLLVAFGRPRVSTEA